MGYEKRIKIYKEFEKIRNSKIIVYITGDRKGWETQIHQEVINFFVHHLDILGKQNKISLYLYTQGGSTLAAWSLVNLFRQFCDEFEVVVPSKAHSAGTLICLGANNIVMTKQATLRPIDPSVNTPLNPHIPGTPENTTMPVGVEAIKGFIELAKEELGIKRSSDLSIVLNALMDKIHPLVLGEVYRARSQIKMLAKKLLNQQIKNEYKKKKIIEFLCSESGSHDYTINRKEANDELQLKIEKPDDTFYNIIKKIFDDINEDLELNSDFNQNNIKIENTANPFLVKRAIIESIDGGSHVFLSEGNIIKQGSNIFMNKTFEGWKYERKQ